MIDIVFDGPPGPQSGRFVEVERDGKSISFGKWSQREDGLWSLSIPDPEEKGKVIERWRELADKLAYSRKTRGKIGSLEMEFMRQTNMERLGEIDRLRAELAELRKRVQDTLYINVAHMQGTAHRPPVTCSCELCRLYRDCARKEQP